MLHKFHLHEQGFLEKGLISLIGPFYSQELLWCFKQAIIANPHLFTFNEREADTVITNSRALDKYVTGKPLVVLVDSAINYYEFLDIPDNVFIQFTSQADDYQYVKRLECFAPYDYDRLPDFPQHSEVRYNQFIFSVFAETINDMGKIVHRWLSESKYYGTLYCFYHNRTFEDAAVIDLVTKASKMENKNVVFTYIHHNSREIVYRALQASVFSLHLDDSLSYPFWAARLRCYPVVKPTDVFSRYVSYLPKTYSFTDIVDSFYDHPKRLAEMIEQLGKISIPQFNVADYLIGASK